MNEKAISVMSTNTLKQIVKDWDKNAGKRYNIFSEEARELNGVVLESQRELDRREKK